MTMWALNFDGFICRSNGSEAGDRFMRAMAEGYSRLSTNRATCTARLRAMGVKLAHANDGWVDRECNNVIPPSYRLFDDAPGIGDLIAIGSATEGPDVGRFWLARVTKVTDMLFGSTRYDFVRTGDNVVVGEKTISPDETK